MRAAFAGVFAAHVADRVRARLRIPCEVALVDDREMKPTAILINVARGEVVDEDALYLALRDGTIAGAALDVWYRYPAGGPSTLPGHRPFHTLSNVLMTPHVSGWTEGMMDARAGVIAENIHRIARGDPPLNLIR